MAKMKLFVWDNVLTDYTDGLIVAYAANIKDARNVVRLESGLVEFWNRDDSSVYRIVHDIEPTVYDGNMAARIMWGGG
jgi:hypothetical protein